MPIRHNHVMTGADPADSNMVGTTKWNADHSLPALSECTGLATTAQLGSGTANNTTFLRGDQTWATPAGGSGVAFREFPLIWAPIAFTNLVAAFVEAAVPVSRSHINFTGFSDLRIQFCMSVAAVTGDVQVQYSTASNYASPISLVQFDNPTATNTLYESPWTAIPVGAKADVYVRVGMLNGNTTEDPSIRFLRLQVR